MKLKKVSLQTVQRFNIGLLSPQLLLQPSCSDLTGSCFSELHTPRHRGLSDAKKVSSTQQASEHVQEPGRVLGVCTDRCQGAGGEQRGALLPKARQAAGTGPQGAAEAAAGGGGDVGKSCAAATEGHAELAAASAVVIARGQRPIAHSRRQYVSTLTAARTPSGSGIG